MFFTLSNGWIACHPRVETIEACKAHQSRLDELPTDVPYKDDCRWTGPLLETAFDYWLRSHEIPHVRNGGVDGKPDFEVGGFAVGVKCRTLKKAAMRPEYVVNVPDKHIQRGVEKALVFGCYETFSNRLLILGAISRNRFLQVAQFVEKGAAINPYTYADEAAWSIEARCLVQPLGFLELINGQAATPSQGTSSREDPQARPQLARPDDGAHRGTEAGGEGDNDRGGARDRASISPSGEHERLNG